MVNYVCMETHTPYKEFPLLSVARGHLAGTRTSAIAVRQQAEAVLLAGSEVVLNFSGVEVTQSFVDELVGYLILRYGPDILQRMVFKGCSDNVRAIIEFVAADRSDQYVKSHSH